MPGGQLYNLLLQAAHALARVLQALELLGQRMSRHRG
jgi:hypothetical protein